MSMVKNSNSPEEVYKTGGKPKPEQDPQNVHPGLVMAGFVITALIVYALYIQNYQYAAYNTALLTFLAIGSKALD